ncbi:MAG: hypothetical protein KDC67_00370, partial [Ignavibacteriae bacterium]|nr:hypothetical protein [Ignavibacteriota bacterium]
FALGSESYRNFLGLMFYLFEPSTFLACILSVLAYIVSVFPLIYLLEKLKLKAFMPHIIFIYSFFPSMILFGSVPLRESFQVCYCILMTKFILQFHIEKKIRYLFFSSLFAFLMGTLHFGLMAFAAIVLICSMFISINLPKTPFIFSKSRITLIILMIMNLGYLAIVLPDINNLGFITRVVQGESITEYTDTYRGNLVEKKPRSGYEIELDTSSPFNLLISVSTMLLYYLAYPFPWKISAVIDIYASGEALFRVCLIYYSIKGWFISVGEVKKIIFFLLIIYFANAAIWAMGTSNFGTGMRHNLTHFWIICITGVPYLVLSIRQFAKKYLLPNKDLKIDVHLA